MCVFCRLGHGDLVMEGSVSAPACVQTFHMLHIRVEAVSCGGEHTLAITQQGVGTHLKFTLHTSKYTLHTHQGGGCGGEHTLAITQQGVGTTHGSKLEAVAHAAGSPGCM